MRAIARMTAAAVTGALVLVTAATAAAGRTATTYHGVFTGRVSYGDCVTTDDPPQPMADPIVEASGQWTLVERGNDMATVSVNIFTGGSHHVSFGGSLPQVHDVDGAEVAVRFETGAGWLTISVDADSGALAYTFADGYASLDGAYTCDVVTYHGTVTG